MRNRTGLSMALTLLCALVIGLPSACAGPRPVDPAPTSPTPTPALTMLWYGSSAEEALLRQQLAGFDIEVKLEVVPADSLPRRLDQLVTAGTAPDVVRTSDLIGHRGEFNALHNADTSEFLVGLDWPMTRGRDIIALPYSTQTSLTWVNADLFERAGVPLPTSETPWKTWDHMLQAARRTVGDEQQARSLVAIDESSPLAVDAFLWQAGVSYFDEKRGGVSWRIDQGSAALSRLAEVIQSGSFANTFALDLTISPPQPKQPARALFESGQVPVMLSDSSYRPPASMRAIALPDPCERQCGPMPGADYLVSLGSNPAAERLMTYLTMPNAQMQRAELGILPTQQSVLDQMQRMAPDQLPDHARVAATELTLPPPAARATGYSPARPRADETTKTVLATLVDEMTSPQRASELIGRGAAQAFAKVR